MRASFAVLAILGVVACTETREPRKFEPEPTTYNGREAFFVDTVVMGGEYPPSDSDRAAAEVEAKTGSKFNRLPAQAKKSCPMGYHILSQDEIKASSYMIQATHSFVTRWTQRFVIVCN